MSKLNKNLHQAKAAKKDEFYTQLSDIENELKHYKEHFKGKIVYCNCDDPFESNFFKYFALNFNVLGLKKLIATSYVLSVSKEDLDTCVSVMQKIFPDWYKAAQSDFAKEQAKKAKEEQEGKTPRYQAYKIELTKVEDLNGDGAVDLIDVELLVKGNTTPLDGDGDFRSPECVELLKQADIVCTNPPFSLFREYVAQLVEYDKKFLIIGNNNAITYKEIFKLIKDNKLWLGYGVNKTMEFRLSDDYDKFNRIEDGNKYGKVPAISWFTNLDVKKRHEKLTLYREYSPELYPKYDNYDAIEVSKVADIPKNYEGIMGVPITVLDKFCPEQFEIVSANNYRTNEDTPFKEHGLIKDKDGAINGKPTYVRIVIRRK